MPVLQLRTSTLVAVASTLLGLAMTGRPCTGQSVESNQGADAETADSRSLNDPIGDVSDPLDEYVTADMVARKAFGPPPGARPLSKSNLWIDREKNRVYLDGYVAIREGALEMFACPMGTKEHESLVGTLPKAREVHAALLAIGAKPGSPVEFAPEFKPASGQRVRVWVSWLDEDGNFKVTDGRKWIQRAGTGESMSSEWVFAGSGFWKDPSDGRTYYRADSGDMICVSNFSTAMLDVEIASSAQADQLLFEPFTERIPDLYTPVRLVLVPIPEDAAESDKEEDAKAEKKSESEKATALEPPTKEILPQSEEALNRSP